MSFLWNAVLKYCLPYLPPMKALQISHFDPEIYPLVIAMCLQQSTINNNGMYAYIDNISKKYNIFGWRFNQPLNIPPSVTHLTY